MKKVLIVFSLWISGLSYGQEVNFSLLEIKEKILQSSTLTTSGKLLLMDYFEVYAPLDTDLKQLSESICDESAFLGTSLFISERKSCQENFKHFLTSYDKSVDININVDIGPDGKLRGGNLGVIIRTK